MRLSPINYNFLTGLQYDEKTTQLKAELFFAFISGNEDEAQLRNVFFLITKQVVYLLMRHNACFGKDLEFMSYEGSINAKTPCGAQSTTPSTDGAKVTAPVLSTVSLTVCPAQRGTFASLEARNLFFRSCIIPEYLC